MLMAIIGLVPGLLGFAQFVTGKIFDAKVKLTAIRIGGDVDKARTIVALAQTEAHERTAWLGIVAGNSILTMLVVFFAGPFVLYIWKVVAWDIVLSPILTGHTGYTDPIRGQVSDWGNTIIVAIFGAPTTVTIAKMVLAKKSGDGQ